MLRKNQWTGFYMITASVMKELNIEAATGGFPSKKVFLQISQNSQENILSASPATLSKKNSDTGIFLWILRNF